MKRKPNPVLFIFLGLYAAAILISFVLNYPLGKKAAENFLIFGKEMITILPGAFIIIGLADVWVPKKTVTKHLGKGSGKLKSYLWMILLSSTTVGGLYVAFPVAWTLWNKGTRIGLIFTYVGLSGVVRIPMTFFEISFMGLQFTVIRYVVSIPLVILFSELLGKFLEKKKYSLYRPGNSDGE